MASAIPAATPLRPLPGAFMNTPAVSRQSSSVSDQTRRRLFPESSFRVPNDAITAGGAPMFPAAPGGGGAGVASRSGVQPMPMPSSLGAGAAAASGALQGVDAVDTIGPAPERNITPLADAARAVNGNLQLDASFPDLDSYCRPGASSEYDITPAESAWAPFQRTQSYAIPDEILALHGNSELSITLGLFAEINHAWAAVDNGIFLWDYTRPNPEVIGFEDQPHSIRAVALVPPKPGVFLKSITHVLAVATINDIILLGLAAETAPTGVVSVALYATKMSLHLRGGPEVNVIAGSASGRIFFGTSSEPDIYELYYQREEGWFSGRCGKRNHDQTGWTSVVPAFLAKGVPEGIHSIVVDDSRNLLYSLSSRSTIRTYHMESPEKLYKLIEKEKTHCLRDITHMITLQSRNNLLNTNMNIVSISPISSKEASKLHLMALTDTGCRLFLSATNASSYTMGANTGTPPQSMQVQFIKFPPRDTGRERRGSSVLDEAVLDTTSRSLELSAMGSRFAPGFFVDFVSKNGDTRSHLLFVSAPDSGRIMAPSPTTQLRYYEHGTWIPVDGVGYAIGLITRPFAATQQPVGFGNELAVQFDDTPSEFAVLTNQGVYTIRRRRLVDIFASTMRNAAGDDGVEKEIHKFYHLYGRVETISAALAVACGQGNDGRSSGARAVDQITLDRARTVFVNYGGSATITEAVGNVIRAESVQLSNRYKGLSLYLSRLVHLLWKSAVIQITNTPAGGAVVNSVFPTTKLAAVQQDVVRLQDFLKANRAFIQGLSGPSDLKRAENKQQEVAFQTEHQALNALVKLMASISEGISFVLMLFDERVTDIYARLDETARQGLRSLTYERLFSQASGMELAKLLVKAIVNRNIENGSNVETVADALRRRCGSFCSAEDVVVFKAQELLKRASDPGSNPTQQRYLLNESRQLFESIASYLSFANLQSAVNQYTALQYFAGAIQLCLTVARESDRGNSALSWVNDGKPAGDYREGLYNKRQQYYGLVHDVLQRLDEVSASQQQVLDGKLTAIGTRRLEAYEVVNESDDEVFHFDLYDWYLQQGWTDRILVMESPHVVTFLERLASTSVEHAELLCQFFKRRDRYFEAAQVQLHLAKSNFPISIKTRITMLSLSKANAAVHTVGVANNNRQILTHEVEELLECAQIQDDLLERLLVDDRIPDENKDSILEKLDGPVVPLTELFNEYADQAHYFDICLLIFHSAGFTNASVINKTWLDLIDQVDSDVAQQQAEWSLAHTASAQAGDDDRSASPPKKYEALSTMVVNLAHRMALDAHVFPVATLLQEVCRYAWRTNQDARIGADPDWPVELFIQALRVPHEMVVRSLDDLWEAQGIPFRGTTRIRVVEWIVAAVLLWVREAGRRGGVGGGAAGGGGVGAGLSAAMGGSLLRAGGGKALTLSPDSETSRTWAPVRDLLDRCQASLPTQTQSSGTVAGAPGYQGGAPLEDVRRKLREALRGVDAILAPGRYS